MNVYDFLGVKITSDTPIVPVAGGDTSTNAAMLYFKAAAVDTAISYISSALASCEFKVYERGEEVRGDLYRRLNVQPNPNQNAAQMREQLVYKLMADGQALIVPVKDSLYVADGFATERVLLGENVYRSVAVEGQSIRKEFTASGAILLTWGNTRTRALIDGLFTAYADLMTAAIDGFTEGNASKWVLSLDQAATGDRAFAKAEARERADPRNAIQTFMRNSNAVYVQTRGQSLERVNMGGSSSTDVINLRKDAFETVASVFRIPPSMLLGNMTNLNDVVDEFLTFTVKPLAAQMGQELTAKLVTPADWERGSRIVVDTSRIRIVDIFSIAPSVSQLIGAGFSLDEVRDQLDWPLIGTDEAQEHLITRNYGPLEDVLRQMGSGGGETS